MNVAYEKSPRGALNAVNSQELPADSRPRACLPSPPQIRRVSEFSSRNYELKPVAPALPSSTSPQSVMQYPYPNSGAGLPHPPSAPAAQRLPTQLFPPEQQAKRAVPVQRPPAPSQTPQLDFHYVLATVRRPHPSVTWGLSLQELSPGVFMICGVCSAATSIVRGYCEAASPVHPTSFLFRNSQPLHILTRTVLTERTPLASSMRPVPMPTLFRPGDVVLSVAGRPAGECKTLTSFCQWLRSEDTVSSLWIVVRCPAAIARTWSRQKPTVTPCLPPLAPPNRAFRDEKGTFLRFDDPVDPDEGDRAQLFLRPIPDVPSWLEQRKRTWRQLYTVRPVEDDFGALDDDEDEWGVAKDFWTPQGFAGFQDWLATRNKHWHSLYSWNRTKRQRLAQDCQETHVSIDDDFQDWLRVRKNQWLVQRRRRQRERGETTTAASFMAGADIVDDLLEEQEQERKALESRPPLDISFIFHSDLGCPDDVVHRLLGFLQTPNHAALLRVSRTTRVAFQARETLWRTLCPDTWTLPRRPRKPWHQIYWSRLREETERRKKKWDDLLTRASQLLFQGDQLSVLEKMVTEAETDYGFDVNFVSGVVCERNSILNLAVIHQRHRVVRWLVDTKDANIESCDRGNFTPLINAAWAGNKFLVRFFMHRGADRSIVGKFHYTKPLAAPDFAGLTAEGWAEKRGHLECAKVLRLGL